MAAPSDRSVLDRFSAFLIESRGYPPESLAREYPIKSATGVVRTDLVILDFERAKPVAAIEVLSREITEARPSFKQVEAVLAALDLSVTGYVVAPSEQGFDIFVRGMNNAVIRADAADFPSYSGLVNAGRAQEQRKVQEEKKAVIDYFRWTCYGLAFSSVLIVVLRVTGWVKIPLSAEDLSLLGVAIALVLIPGAAKLKIFGIEFERLAAAHERKSDS